jgi:hypothetical protein
VRAASLHGYPVKGRYRTTPDRAVLALIPDGVGAIAVGDEVVML